MKTKGVILIVVAVLVLLITAVVIANLDAIRFIAAAAEFHFDSKPNVIITEIGLSEWESNSSPKLVLHIGDFGANYCIINDDVYMVNIDYEEGFDFYKSDGMFETVYHEDMVGYTSNILEESVWLFETKKILCDGETLTVYIDSKVNDIFAGEVSKLSFHRIDNSVQE